MIDKTEVYKAQQWSIWKFNMEFPRPEIREFAEKHHYNPFQAVSRLVTIERELQQMDESDDERKVLRAYCFKNNTNPAHAKEVINES